MNKTFVIRTEAVRLVAVDWLAKVPLDPIVELIARPWKSRRSNAANRLYWSTVQQAAHEVGYSADELHEILLARFFGAHEIGIGDTVLRVPNERSKTQDTKKFSEYYEWAVAFMATELGVRLAA